jgi:uncharacterized surface protein with fasciclin (FAS1) repeats
MNRLSFFRPRCLLLFFAICLAGVSAEAKPAKILDLTDTVLANRIMTKFALVIRGSELASFLSSRGPFTLFAPTDSAFSKLPPGELDLLLRPENRDVLQQILLYHVVNGNRYSAKDLLTLKTLPSCDGPPLALRTSHSGAQFVEKAKILRADVRCENGLLHQIDTVLIPPGLVLPTASSPGTSPEPAAAPATNAAPVSPSTNAAENPATNAPVASDETNVAPAAVATNTPGTTNAAAPVAAPSP